MTHHTQSIKIGKNELWQIIHNLYRLAKTGYGTSYTIYKDWQKQNIMADHKQSSKSAKTGYGESHTIHSSGFFTPK